MVTRTSKYWVRDTKEQTGLWRPRVHKGTVLGIVYCEEWSEIAREWDLDGKLGCISCNAL